MARALVADRGHRVLVGTTSWSEKSLIESGLFYPSAARTPEERLRHYAGRFPITEVDSTYYALPSEHNAALWAQRTPPGFVFDVKVFRLFTHHRTPVAALPPDLRGELQAGSDAVYLRHVRPELVRELWRRFRAGIEPLRRANRLGVVLMQFAPWFVHRQESLDYIASCLEMLAGYDVAVELRNKSWFSSRHAPSTLSFEREHGVVHVVADEPQGFPSSVPPIWAVTAPGLAVVRLHGRNRSTWQARGRSASDRFAYSYGDAELRELSDGIGRLASSAREVHVLFNNCHLDYAQRNAARMVEILTSRFSRELGGHAARA
jgi:uncharacterized protein YecE (DUF72 family)